MKNHPIESALFGETEYSHSGCDTNTSEYLLFFLNFLICNTFIAGVSLFLLLKLKLYFHQKKVWLKFWKLSLNEASCPVQLLIGVLRMNVYHVEPGLN